MIDFHYSACINSIALIRGLFLAAGLELKRSSLPDRSMFCPAQDELPAGS